MGQASNDPTYGLFVKFTLTPKGPVEAEEAADGSRLITDDSASAPPEASRLTTDEPSVDEELVAFVMHAGSCNTVGGCRGATRLPVNPRVRYSVTVSTVLVDMEDDSEKLASISVGSHELGECNPSPASDFDCGFFDCFRGQPVPPEATASGELLLEAHSVRTNNDCICNRELATCYATALAEMYAALGENLTDTSYGMYVRFSLTPGGLLGGISDNNNDSSISGSGALQGGHAPESLPWNGSEDSFSEEPLDDEVIEAYVGNVGSCNTDEGCRATTRVRVNPRVRYAVTVTTAMVDMAEPSEKLVSVSVGGWELGECNPSPEDDFDCGYADCFKDEAIPPEVTSGGFMDLKVHAVRTSSDCHCNKLHGYCYSAAIAAIEEKAAQEPTTDPRYGMFVRFTLMPLKPQAKPPPALVTRRCCRAPAGPSAKAEEAGAQAQKELPTWARLQRMGAECVGADVLLGVDVPLGECLEICLHVPDCERVASGFGKKEGLCFWEVGNCTEFEDDSYNIYEVGEALAEDCTGACAEAEEEEIVQAATGPGLGEVDAAATADAVDLLITEEGWGLSSANWMIRRSEWSIDFLDRAFRLCQEEMPLFGDQDAMIHLLLNERALLSRRGDGMDPHAAVIPQHEINAYDALNAFYMEADAYSEGDLLVTFPGCKEAGACNPLFRLAAAQATGGGAGLSEKVQSWAQVRLFGPPQAAAEMYEAARQLR